MTQRILVPTDGSPCSIRAAQYAVRLMNLDPALEVTVFTVDNIPRRLAKRKFFWISSERSNPEKIESERFEDPYSESRERILAEVKAVFKQAGFKARTGYSRGNPAEEIVRYAAENEVGMIIMGHRGAAGLQEILMGSVSHKVLQLASCPVILVK